jgi:hypothetical protein
MAEQTSSSIVFLGRERKKEKKREINQLDGQLGLD